jgi:23S rRNA pseudouridine1911/1915/1917 synthase
MVDASAAGMRLDKFLAAVERLGSRGRAGDALAKGKVFVNGEEASKRDGSRRLAAGDQVRAWEDRPGSSRRRTIRPPRAGELEIVYQDPVLIVVNKPPGLLSVPLERQEAATSVQDELMMLVVHRIDRDTSGLVVFATRRDAQAKLRNQFRRREPERVYLAVVYGHPTPASGIWRDRLVWDHRQLVQKETHPNDPRGQHAESRYRVIERLKGASLIEVRLVTGRRNQIRLQARLHGHTLVGEVRYVYGPEELRPIDFPRQALHAYRLAFQHPVTGEPLSFESPLPADMIELTKKLRE